MKHARSDYNQRIQDSAGKIPENEPVFLLRAQDKYAAQTLLAYAALLMSDDMVDSMIIEKVLQQAQAMREWPNKKAPDVPWGS